MTRTRERGRSMGNVLRAQIANRARAALFVRIHADGSADRSVNGTFVLYPALRRGWTRDILPAARLGARGVPRRPIRPLGVRGLGILPRSAITRFHRDYVPGDTQKALQRESGAP